jgi:putative oxidoreductase
MIRKIPVEPIVALLVALFVYTALSKLIDFPKFSGEMHNQPLPRWFTNILVFVIPGSELILVVMLITKSVRLYGLLFSFALLLVFTIYTGMILVRSFDYIPCSCAGIFSSMSWSTHLIVNVVFTTLALLGFLIERRRHKNSLPPENIRDASA